MKQGAKSDRNKQILTRVLNGETITIVAKDNGLSYNRTRVIIYECIARLLYSNKRDAEHISLIKLRGLKDFVLSKL